MVGARIEGLINISLVNVKNKGQSSPVHPDRQDRACQEPGHAPVIFPEQKKRQRPENIKLLFNCKGPGMTESCIRISVQRLIIIADIKQRGQRLWQNNPGVAPDEDETE